MKCPFCEKEGEATEVTSKNVVERRCPSCKAIVAAYQKGLEKRLGNLISLERFERSSQ
jgi:hypothetical protein